MKVPLEWLKDYVEITLTPTELAERLTYAGLEVEAMDYVGLPLPEGRQSAKISGLAWDRSKIVVGAVTEVKEHPNADRLLLAEVDDGSRRHRIVTGAPNLFPYKRRGPLPRPLKVAFALEGAQLYDPSRPGRQLTTLCAARIRGVESNAMACSEKELGISDDHEGIIILDHDALPGTPLADYLGDVVYEIAITPNQARNANVLGVAREIAALTGRQVREPDYGFVAEGPGIEGQVRIEIREAELNPRFVLALIKDVEIKASPYRIQHRLRLAGVRPINNIVDMTAYVMLELGQPLHAFDYDILVQRAGEKAPTIITRLPEAGETLTTLDGVNRWLDDFTILVCDTAGALSLGGIMGGEESKVNDDTRCVLLEGAAWNFINIRRTLRSQKMESEAGYRFSRGIHPAMAERGVRRAIELMRELSGGVVAKGLVDVYAKPEPPVRVDLPLAEIRRLLGITMAADEAAAILHSLQFQVDIEGETLQVAVPDHRLDIGTGVVGQADLIEEIARIYGYDRIPETQLSEPVPEQRANPLLEAQRRVRDWLVQAGLQEIVTYRLTTAEREALLLPPSEAPAPPYVILANPIVSDRVKMRRTLLAGALEILASNLRFRDRIALFEIGAVYLPVEGSPLPDEPLRLALVLTGPREAPYWEGFDEEPVDFFDLKGVVEGLTADLRLRNTRYEPAEHPSFHPAKCARLLLEKKEIGVFGELHPQVRENFQLPDQPVLAGEFDLELLLASVPERRQVEAVQAHPAVLEDLAVVVDESVPAGEVAAEILRAGKPLVREAQLFDVYRGRQIGSNRKSLAYSVTFQSDTTLTDTEVAKVRSRIVKQLEKMLGAKLRS